MKTTRQISFASTLFFFCATAAVAQEHLYTLDLSQTTLGTAWSGAMTTPVTLDFGNGLGTGTVSFTSINGGFIGNPVAGAAGTEAFTDLSLSTGDLLDRTHELYFSLRRNASPEPLGGFEMTVSLDEGNFPAGSVFLPRSLDWRPAVASPPTRQYLEVVSGLTTLYPDQLPSDFGGAAGTLVETAPGSGLYSPELQGSVSRGAVFAIAGNSFTVRFLADSSYGGGVALGIATPILVPEPGSAILFAVAGVAFGWHRRRR